MKKYLDKQGLTTYTEQLTDKFKSMLGYVTPEMYGAVGDGVTDDTQAIQDAIDNAGNLTVYLQAGVTYAIAGVKPIIVKSGTKIRFDGTLKATAAAHTSLQLFDGVTSTSGYTGVHDVVIYGNGTYDGNANNISTAYQTAIKIYHCNNITIRGITIKNSGRYHAMEIGGSKNVLIDSVKFKGVYLNPSDNHPCEALQIEKITEGGAPGAIPYDLTPCQNLTIRNCYFGPSTEGGKMYSAIGCHDSLGDADTSMANVHENVIIEGCYFEDTSWDPYNDNVSQGVPLYNPYFGAIGITYNFKNLIIRDNVFDNMGIGIAICLYMYNDGCFIERNKIRNVYGTGISFYQNNSNISIIDNEIDSFGSYCNSSSKQDLAVGIYIGTGCYDDLKIKGNFIKSKNQYATLPIHLPSVQFTDFGKINVQDNFIDVLSVLQSSQIDTFQNNYRRYNRDNSIILYDSSSVFSGSIPSSVDLRLFSQIEITFLIADVAYDTQIFTQDQLLKSRYTALRAFNLPNTGTTAQCSYYEMNITVASDYMSLDIGTNIRFDVGSGVAYVVKYDSTAPTDNNFLNIVKIRGYYGQNMIV